VETLIRLVTQNPLAVVVGCVGLFVLGLLLVRTGRKRLGRQIDPQIASDLAEGNYKAAAEHALEAGRLRTAYDLFLRAQQPLRAAQIAVRQDRLQDAAELFEKSGHRKRAAELYQQVGMPMKAEQLLTEEQRVLRAREEQKSALRQRLDAEGDREEDLVGLDRPPPAAKTPGPPALDLGGAPAAPAEDLAPGAVAKTPSLFGIQALLNQAADKTALALAATQSSLASLAAGPVGTHLSPRTGEPNVAEAQPSASGDVPPGELSPGAVKPTPDERSFDDAKPAPEPLSFAEVSGPEVAAAPTPLGKGQPEERPACATPRTPTLAVGPSLGTYRMLHPSEPEVFTPPPTPKTPGPSAKRPAAATHPSGERPSLCLGTRPSRGDPNRTPTPATSPRPQAAGSTPRPTTPGPTPRSGTPGRRRE
jgi:hypothetical protein